MKKYNENFFKFELLGDDTYSVTGRKDAAGNCCDIEFADIPESYKGKPVTEIGYRAFAFCPTLKAVNIPDSITSIRSEAFNGCLGLESATIGNGVVYIYHGAFVGCENLKSVTLGKNVTYICKCAFFCCKKLENIIIPNSVKRIDSGAFHLCDSLKCVTVPAYTIFEANADGETPFPSGCVINRETYENLFDDSDDYDDEDLKELFGDD